MSMRRVTVSLIVLVSIAAIVAIALLRACGPPTEVAFTKKASFGLTATVTDLKIGDLDGDGRNELIVLTCAGRRLFLTAFSIRSRRLAQVGRAAEVTSLAPLPPCDPLDERFSAGHLDGDRFLDTLLANSHDVFEWNGEEFTLAITRAVLGRELSLRRNDDVHLEKLGLSGSGRDDLVCVPDFGEQDAVTVLVYANTANSFRLALSEPVKDRTAAVLAGDADNDGHRDLVRFEYTGDDEALFEGREVVIRDVRTHSRRRFNSPGDLAGVGDVDNDGMTELLLEPDSRHFSDPRPPIAFLQVVRGRSLVRVATGIGLSEWRIPRHSEACVVVGDVDNDGKNELIAVDAARPREMVVYTVKE